VCFFTDSYIEILESEALQIRYVSIGPLIILKGVVYTMKKRLAMNENRERNPRG
jgi:hypothetical protein